MKIKYLIACIALIAACTGCKNALEYTASIYISEAQQQPTKTITIYEAGEKASFSVTASAPVSQDTRITLEIRPELLQEYNTKYGRTCLLLDDQSYEFAKREVTIKAGSNISDEVEIIVTKLLEPGAFYCLPMRIASTDGSMPVLEPSSTLYLIFRAPVHSQAVYVGSSNKYIVPGFYDQRGADVPRDLSTIQEMTVECRVFVNKFKTSDPYITSIMGLEGSLCMRFGDVKISNDVLQVCKGDCQPAAVKSPCSTGKWYHVAAVWTTSVLRIYIDGKLITETNHPVNEVIDISQVQLWNGNGIGFGLGVASNYNGNRPLDGYLAEARVWTKALSTNEIANLCDLVVADPQAEGLLAYWKMNEFEATTLSEPYSRWTLRNKIIDQTGHGYDAYGQSGNPTFLEATW